MQLKPEIRPVRSRTEFLSALRVRVRVFVEEQGGPPEDEPDAWDSAARHFVVLAEEQVVGTARLYHPAHGLAKVGRLALTTEYRGRGWGALLLGELVAQARALGVSAVILDAQVSAVPFYARFGFIAEGEEFLEGGIVHRRMRLLLK